MPELGFVLLVVLALVLLNGLFVAAEFAIIATSRPAMQARAARGDARAARIVEILNDPVQLDRYVATAQLGITFASLGLGMYGEHKLAMYFEGWLIAAGFTSLGAWLTAHGVAVVIAITLMTYLHIVLGEMIPKSLAISQSARTALWVLRPMLLVRLLLAPLVLLLNWLGNTLLGWVGFQRSRVAVHSQDELESLARESQAGGLLGQESARVFQELIDFSELTAGEAMVPRVRVVGLMADAGLDDIARLLAQQPHTRYPIYRENLDRIIGTIHIRDLLTALAERRGLRAADVRETAWLPQSTPLVEVLATMHRIRNQMVVIMDEHGGTAGTLTIEDLYAETVGEVEEGSEDTPDLVALDDGGWQVQGTLRIDTLGDALGLALSHEDVATVSGLLLAELGRPARVGDQIEWGGLRLEVGRLHGRGVSEAIVRVTR
jgi:CBS domain containing-hemolysin-like protein